jgi:beta-lactamase class A
MKPNKSIPIFLAILLSTAGAVAQRDTLTQRLARIAKSVPGKVGVAILGLEDRDTISIHGHSSFPMQSVYKFPLAMAILDRVDKGIFSLDQKIHVTKDDLRPNTWSPLRDKYPGGNVDVTLNELLAYTASQSDNNGCDILFRLLGGTDKADAYIHSIGIKEIAITATEERMQSQWDVQFTNVCTPTAMIGLLKIFYKGKGLSKSSRDLLWRWMTETTTGPNKIKGLLPSTAVVTHKTGMSGAKDGVIGATNDVGIVTLPNGKHFAIAVFVSNATASEADCERAIAKISRAAWDYFATK